MNLSAANANCISRFLLNAMLAVAFCACGLTAAADDFPSHTITMVVPFPAGGPTDTLARILCERLTTVLGKSVIVENTTGAGGSIGVGRVVRAAPDGYTLSIGHIGTHVFNGAIYKLPYDLVKDMEPVSLIASNPQLIMSSNDVPANNLKELVAWVKANPDKVTISGNGVGTPGHISAVEFQIVTGTKLQIVQYRGSAPAIQDLIAGRTNLDFDQASNALPQVRAGKIKGYAVTSKTRWSAAPDIPTVDEAGLPGFYMEIRHGIWVPKGTPGAVVAKLNGAIVEALADPALRQRLATLGQDPVPREQQNPEALAAWQRSEIDKWWPVIRAAGIKPE